ncbi:glycoside hydrolase superfamily [Jimgerdemannia flammicorona]|uniref:Glycoside hydrolase superfamily n=1 Tax=Jimgerdemannia flammicorona TaxID=994334 RepID=A0A433DKU1_9FUNG|nr:glycoside hydrolase superfamily [Jimgerdemannia flammicorona]
MKLIASALIITIATAAQLVASQVQPSQPFPLSRVTHIDSHRNFIDEHGRTMFFRGLNVVVKKSPYAPSLDHFDPFDSFTEEDAKLLSDLNVNVIRLETNLSTTNGCSGALWAGIEPVRGQYNETLLGQLKSITTLAQKYGIYVLLEAHQDLMSERFCGNGLPDWAFPTDLNIKSNFPSPIGTAFKNYDSRGYPTEEECATLGNNWPLYSFTTAINNAWDAFFKNETGIRDAFSTLWTKLAQEFKEYPNLLGYEILNEPWIGNLFKNPALILPGVADYKKFYALWSEVANSIRSVDGKHLVFFEGNLMYPIPQGPNIGPVQVTMAARKFDANRLGSGYMLTEFQFWWTGNLHDIAGYLKVIQQADEYQQSIIGWKYKKYGTANLGDFGSLYDNQGIYHKEYEKLLGRTFASAVQGVPNKIHFDDATAIFTLQYTADSLIQAPTEIRIAPAVFYPQGYSVDVSPAGAAQYYAASVGVINVWAASGFSSITIKVHPK